MRSSANRCYCRLLLKNRVRPPERQYRLLNMRKKWSDVCETQTVSWLMTGKKKKYERIYERWFIRLRPHVAIFVQISCIFICQQLISLKTTYKNNLNCTKLNMFNRPKSCTCKFWPIKLKLLAIKFARKLQRVDAALENKKIKCIARMKKYTYRKHMKRRRMGKKTEMK